MRISPNIALYACIAYGIIVAQVYSCVVTPSSTAVVAGSSASVSCRVEGVDSVIAWRRGNDTWSAPRVYSPPVYNENGAVKVPRYVADGYSVDDSSTSEVVLTVDNASSAYVDYYFCFCQTSQLESTYISVLDAEPRFFASDSVTIEDPIVLTCSLAVTGNVNSSIEIIDSSGNVVKHDFLSISSASISQTHSLTYNISQFSETTYYCNVSLRDRAIGRSTEIIFTRRLSITMNFSVGNVSMISENPEVCRTCSSCLQGVKIMCKINGQTASTYQWAIYYNSTISPLNASDSYSTQYAGQQTIFCTASKRIANTFFSGSANFTTNVTDQVYIPPPPSSTPHYRSNIPLIVGLVVGLGGGILLVLLIACVIFLCKRHKRKTACCTLEQPNNAAVDDTTKAGEKISYIEVKKKNTNEPVSNGIEKSKGSDETFLVENNLYSSLKCNENHAYNLNTYPSDGAVYEA